MVDYQNDGVNKKAVYESRINKKDFRGKARLTLQNSKNFKGVKYKTITKTYNNFRASTIRNGEERKKHRNNIKIPQLMMGAMYIQPIENTERDKLEKKHKK